MSESVKIGGIGKNPAIEKINTVNAMEAKDYAVKRMEKLVGKKVYEDVPLHFPVEKIETEVQCEKNGWKEHGYKDGKQTGNFFTGSFPGNRR